MTKKDDKKDTKDTKDTKETKKTKDTKESKVNYAVPNRPQDAPAKVNAEAEEQPKK